MVKKLLRVLDLSYLVDQKASESNVETKNFTSLMSTRLFGCVTI